MEFSKNRDWAILPAMDDENINGSFYVPLDTTIFANKISIINLGLRVKKLPQGYILHILPFSMPKTYRILNPFFFATNKTLVIPMITSRDTFFKSGDILCHIELKKLSSFLPKLLANTRQKLDYNGKLDSTIFESHFHEPYLFLLLQMLYSILTLKTMNIKVFTSLAESYNGN